MTLQTSAKDRNTPHEGASFGLRIASPRNFWGGVALLVVSVIVFWFLSDLRGMKGYTFGPATMPRLIAGALAFLSVILIGMGLFTQGPSMPRFAVRGPAMLFISIVFFALSIGYLGIVLSSFATYLLAALASKETKWGEAVIAAIGMTVFCTALFYYGLSLPFGLWPSF